MDQVFPAQIHGQSTIIVQAINPSRKNNIITSVGVNRGGIFQVEQVFELNRPYSKIYPLN